MPSDDDKSYVTRIRRLEKRVGSLPVLFALFFQHAISNLAIEYTHPLPHWLVYFIISIVIAWIYIREIDKKDIEQAAKNAKEKAKDTVSNSRQSKMDEY